jgi:hypothetical protein
MNKERETQIELDAYRWAVDKLPDEMLEQVQEDVADYFAKAMEDSI